MMAQQVGAAIACIKRSLSILCDDEDQRRTYWECVEEDRLEESEDDSQLLVTENQMEEW